MPLHVS
jgi:hypothetical protein